ncbi:hypothetical protein A2316_02190 [Candidatus Falkowbacteria bacterium RIFOXYB2_FULL_38_15]|uniref:Uncharacterized protein n=1 Tax=Candidatus Falkowbacteria bacterium RIFOXYA2_FULL_38_12 TaxID=1797993 RepID=A0A1F5S3Z1_9BACT|nr:MAG: hypothetical protein A2257_00490 [Candidatus Falkowbacteria bacterium RIFOXYA2_FULL_38_12]OGF32619.1 MAG: hypothetical protein A2316_02190 [Candidatus Falkowbacteria bacterium RIFOXYB2_FULL_38_15]
MGTNALLFLNHHVTFFLPAGVSTAVGLVESTISGYIYILKSCQEFVFVEKVGISSIFEFLNLNYPE